MKQAIKKYLQRRGWYYPVKYSTVFRVYQRLFKSYVIKEEKREIAFYRSFLPAGALIFDIGGYDGHKTAAFLKLAGRVVVCEPDPSNLQILKARYSKNKRVSIVAAAVAASIGESVLYIHEEGSAFNTLNPKWKKTLEADNLQKWNERILFSEEIIKVPVTTLDELIKKFGVPAFVKIDTEGSESSVLAGLSQCIPFLSFECMIPDFRVELQQCIDRLLALDPTTMFAVAIEEKITAEGFMSWPALQQWLSQTTIHHFELIARMQTAPAAAS